MEIYHDSNYYQYINIFILCIIIWIMYRNKLFIVDIILEIENKWNDLQLFLNKLPILLDFLIQQVLFMIYSENIL